MVSREAAAVRLIGPRAAHGMFDERSTAVIDNGSDNVRFGFPNKRILNLDRLADRGTEELAKPLQDQRMGGARSACADHLLRDGQIDAHDAIFEEPNPLVSEQLSDNTGQRHVEKGS